MLNSKQRAILRKHANTLSPVFQLGKGEIDEAIVDATNNCLAARELIKLKVLETSPYSTKEAANILAQKTNSESVQIIGGIFVLYKQKQKESAFASLLGK